VLTILSAYCVAGAAGATANLKPRGSFDGWSDLIRQSVVWLGLDCPGQTRQELADPVRPRRRQLRELIAGWQEI